MAADSTARSKSTSQDDPDDEAIITALAAWGASAMTYVVANRMRSMGWRVSTAQVRRRLERLERQGRVQRVPSHYLTQICWAPSNTTMLGGA
jgi:Fe2+ or Zn2+ uptake regulation protein